MPAVHLPDAGDDAGGCGAPARAFGRFGVSDDSPQAYFRLILLTVVGQAFRAAGYALDDDSLQQAGGLFRFRSELRDGLTSFIEFQLLAYTATEFASPQPSRFRV